LPPPAPASANGSAVDRSYTPVTASRPGATRTYSPRRTRLAAQQCSITHARHTRSSNLVRPSIFDQYKLRPASDSLSTYGGIPGSFQPGSSVGISPSSISSVGVPGSSSGLPPPPGFLSSPQHLMLHQQLQQQQRTLAQPHQLQQLQQQLQHFQPGQGLARPLGGSLGTPRRTCGVAVTLTRVLT